MAKKSPYTDKQFLQQLHIEKLRGLENIELSFCENPNEANVQGAGKKYITGIFGKNGSGKTTLLQTILCLYRPKYHRIGGKEKVFNGATWNSKMSRFFKHIDGVLWGDSQFHAIYEHDLLKGDTRTFSTKKVSFSKTTTGKKEWKPRQPQKFNRDIFYIPIQTSVPDIEFIAKDKSNVSYGFSSTGQLSHDILVAAHVVTGIDYRLVEVGKTAGFPSYRVTKMVNGTPFRYHSFNMGAGEQRLFRILDILYNAPKYSLIAIDELDMTLHSAALRKLIEVINNKATENYLQVFFTSHRPELMDLKQVHSYYIMHRGSRTLCLDNPTADCYEEMTGEINKPFVLYLEDEVSKQIATQRLNQLNILHRTNIKRCGTYHNCIMLLAAEICKIHEEEIQNNPIDADTRALNKISDYIAVLDGDVDANDIETEINRLITGGDANSRLRRQWVKQQILQYNSTPSIVQIGKNMNPEEYIHNVFKGLPMPHSSIVTASNSVEILGTDTHEYFTPLLEDNKFSLESIIAEFTRAPQWATYLAPLDIWAQSRKAAYHY